jgi:hypothetical protein
VLVYRRRGHTILVQLQLSSRHADCTPSHSNPMMMRKRQPAWARELCEANAPAQMDSARTSHVSAFRRIPCERHAGSRGNFSRRCSNAARCALLRLNVESITGPKVEPLHGAARCCARMLTALSELALGTPTPTGTASAARCVPAALHSSARSRGRGALC